MTKRSRDNAGKFNIKNVLKLFLLFLIPTLSSFIIFCGWFKNRYPSAHMPGESSYYKIKKQLLRLVCLPTTHTFCEGKYGFYRCLENCKKGEFYDGSGIFKCKDPTGISCDPVYWFFDKCAHFPCYCKGSWQEQSKGKFICVQ